MTITEMEDKIDKFYTNQILLILYCSLSPNVYIEITILYTKKPMIKLIMIKLTRDTCTYNLNDVWGDEGEVAITSSTYLA